MSSLHDDQVEMTIDCRCRKCDTPFRIPLNRDWSSPLYVMHMEREHRMIRDVLSALQKDMLELAGECVEAGVRPELLRRADRMLHQ